MYVQWPWVKCRRADVQRKIVVKRGPNPMLMFRAKSNPNSNPKP